MEGGGRRRLTLWDQMSAVDGGVREVPAGLTLNDVLGTMEKQAALASPAPLARSQSAPGIQPQLSNLTLMDVIREEDPNARSSFEGLLGDHPNRDKKYWKNFKHKLSLKRAGANWTSSIRIPASDIPIRNANAIGNSRSSRQISFSRINSVRYPHSAESTQSDDSSTYSDADRDHSSSSSAPGIRPQISRLCSTRLHQSESTHPGDPDSSDAPPLSQLQSFGRQMSRHNSTRHLVNLRQNSMYNSDVADVAATVDGDEEGNDDTDETLQQAPTRRLAVVLAEERALSAREAVAAQEAAEAAAAAERTQPETESLGSPAAEPQVRMSLMDLMDYNMADEEEEEEPEEEEEEEEVEVEEEESESGEGGVEHKCCVCMVRHKGAAFIPCGHTFCRLCSRELMVGRGNCPLCNRFITEILDIF
ncbi:E3 ubiquitin-protein ligase RNF8-like [Juglans microcarpa x Juglans regia]|uniref:E3 ubiquitin-protein ligase RNF8-like n=1 Tax=Juglans microcarpa x Juglans regia TaxID=2249226 RepID=UPI001B7F3F0C|nr:E3 ubiquitin-protein ligase RNF8-like [Juglans microcarpa x Juglans regia]